MAKQKRLSVELVSTGPIKVGEVDFADGWGKNAQLVSVEGEIADIMVSRDDEAIVGLRILPDGSLIITSYRASYTQPVDTNLRLTNRRPWK